VQDNGTVVAITEGMHPRVRSEDSKASIVPNEFPVEKLLGVQSIPVQESGRSRFRSNDGSDLRGAQDPLAESSKGSHFPTVRRTGHLRFWPDRRKEKRTIPNHGVDQPVASDFHMETPVISARSDIIEKLSTPNPIMLRQMQTTAVTPSGGGKETNFVSEVGLVRSIVHPPTVKKSGPSLSLPTVGATSPQIAPPGLSDAERLNVYSTPAIENQHSNPTQKIPDMQTHVLDDFCEDSQTQEAQQTKVTRSRDGHTNHPLSKSNTEETMVSIIFLPFVKLLRYFL
jgi:hypothetical protein